MKLRRRKIEVGQVWRTKKLDRVNGHIEVTGPGVDLIIVGEAMARSGYSLAITSFGYRAKHYLAIPWEPHFSWRHAEEPIQCYWIDQSGAFLSADCDWGLWLERKSKVNNPMRGLILGPQKQEIVP